MARSGSSHITVIGTPNARIVITTSNGNTNTTMIAVNSNPNTNSDTTVNVDSNGNIAVFTSNPTRRTPHHRWANPTVAATTTTRQQIPRRERVPRMTTMMKRKSPSNDLHDEKKKKTVIGSSPSFADTCGGGGGVKTENQRSCSVCDHMACRRLVIVTLYHWSCLYLLFVFQLMPVWVINAVKKKKK